jgi:hypothetical protein
MTVMAGSLLVFLRRDIGVRLLPRRRFLFAAVVLIFVAWNEWPFDKYLAVFGLVVLLLVFIHHFRHMRRIKRGAPEWHTYDSGKSLLFGFLPLPRTLVQLIIEPVLCGVFGWWLSRQGRPTYFLDWHVNSTLFLGWWITLASAMLFTLENSVRVARREMMLNVGDTVIEAMSYARSAETFTTAARGAGGPAGKSRPSPPQQSWFGQFWKARQAAQQSKRAKRDADERRRRQQEEAQARNSQQQSDTQDEGQAWRDPTAGRMTPEQALEILELKPGASALEIRAAYNRLMQKVHPDAGGSTFFAKQLNLARDTLLRPQRKSG